MPHDQEPITVKDRIKRTINLLSQPPHEDPIVISLLALVDRCSGKQFGGLGELRGLDTAVECLSIAATLTPDRCSSISGLVCILMQPHITRFQRQGELYDINKAIEYGRAAIDLTPLGHPNLSSALTDLGKANCQTNRCGALIILPGQDKISHLPLPNFTGKKSQQARSEIDTHLRNKHLRERGIKRMSEPGQLVNFKSVLANLWYYVVKPVLDFLGYKGGISAEQLPHITWCPTGALYFLPLHAAGDYDKSCSHVFDYVVSSYTPTLTALLVSTPSTLNRDAGVLAIGTKFTPGHNPLSGTAGELKYIKQHAESQFKHSQLVNSQATITAVLDAMETHDWVHLACHAHQNVTNSTKSGFYLHDGMLDLAAINQRSFKNKGLAFLSACQTAKGDEKLPDGAVHLASGMMMAGYASVIATMWSVVDEDAPIAADRVYARLVKHGRVGNGEAGRALHDAVAELRDKVGEEAFERWVPYIHIGS